MLAFVHTEELVLLSTLDPRAPLVLDTHELGRRPGAMRRIRLTVPAPADLGLGGVVGVPEGTELELDLRLESVMEGVLVSGTARATLTGECARCLDRVDRDIEVDVQELFAYPDRAAGNGADPDADEVEMVEGDLVDLEATIRDAIVLALPQAPLCRDDCPGLCPQCGVRLADEPGHRHEARDPRWAALAGLLTDNDEIRESGSQRAGPTEEK
ncbi:MAG TPA: DUF177 domain-containing protein [Jiangellaceae bacterium]